MNKAGRVIPRDIVIGSIMGVIVVVCMVSFLGFYKSADSTFMSDSPELDRFLNQTDQSQGIISDVNDLQGKTQGEGDTSNWFNSLLGIVWGGFKSIFTTIGYAITMFGALGNIGQIPKIVITLLGTIVLVVIIFSIWSAIVQKEV